MGDQPSDSFASFISQLDNRYFSGRYDVTLGLGLGKDTLATLEGFQRKIGKLPAPRLILLSLWIVFKTLVNFCLSWKLPPLPQRPQLLLWHQDQLQSGGKKGNRRERVIGSGWLLLVGQKIKRWVTNWVGASPGGCWYKVRVSGDTLSRLEGLPACEMEMMEENEELVEKLVEPDSACMWSVSMLKRCRNKIWIWNRER